MLFNDYESPYPALINNIKMIHNQGVSCFAAKNTNHKRNDTRSRV